MGLLTIPVGPGGQLAQHNQKGQRNGILRASIFTCRAIGAAVWIEQKSLAVDLGQGVSRTEINARVTACAAVAVNAGHWVKGHCILFHFLRYAVHGLYRVFLVLSIDAARPRRCDLSLNGNVFAAAPLSTALGFAPLASHAVQSF
jgi:hypothetical protein